MFLFKKATTGLVLGGGGARGFFHMGVIKAIQELNLKIDYVAGTSIGAVIGAIFAANPQVNFEKLAADFNYFQALQTMAFGTKGCSTRGLEPLLKKYLPVSRFSELQIPFSFNATDLNQNREVIFDHGDLFPGLLATISIPGIFPPVKIGSQYLIDGGVINNLPLSLIPRASKLIISDITGPIKKITPQTSAVDALYSSVAFMQSHISKQEIQRNQKQKITYLHLADDQIFILDFRRKNYQQLINLGYQAMIK